MLHWLSMYICFCTHKIFSVDWIPRFRFSRSKEISWNCPYIFFSNKKKILLFCDLIIIWQGRVGMGMHFVIEFFKFGKLVFWNKFTCYRFVNPWQMSCKPEFYNLNDCFFFFFKCNWCLSLGILNSTWEIRPISRICETNGESWRDDRRRLLKNVL